MAVIHDETNDPVGGDITVHPQSFASAPQVGALGDFLGGAWTGVKKGGASMVPASIEGQELKDWSHSPATGGMAETAGEWTGDIGANLAPFAIGGGLLRAGAGLLELPGIASATADTIGSLALRMRTSQQAEAAANLIRQGMSPSQAWAKAAQVGNKAYDWMKGAGEYGGKFLESTAKGAFGGGTEAAIQNEDEKDPNQYAKDIATGTITGGVTAGEFSGGRMAWEALPAGIKHLINTGMYGASALGTGLVLWDRLGHGHWVPYHLLGMAAKPLFEAGRAALKLPSSIVGGASEWAREHGLPSLGGSTPSGGDTLAPGSPSAEPGAPPVGSSLLNQPDEPNAESQ